ncbi:MAG: hypothetical protein KJO07_08360, partial [Deltaproteobacteria bacterium]|nr:hypothetical protein [Deltaproteobacteria bacterium]
MANDFVDKGRALVTSGQYQEAVKICRLGLLANPTDLDGRLVLGSALLALKRYDEVLAEMRVALEVDNVSTTALTLKGEALLRKGGTVQALEVLGQAQQVSPGDARVANLISEASGLGNDTAITGKADEQTLDVDDDEEVMELSGVDLLPVTPAPELGKAEPVPIDPSLSPEQEAGRQTQMGGHGVLASPPGAPTVADVPAPDPVMPPEPKRPSAPPPMPAGQPALPAAPSLPPEPRFSVVPQAGPSAKTMATAPVASGMAPGRATVMGMGPAGGDDQAKLDRSGDEALAMLDDMDSSGRLPTDLAGVEGLADGDAYTRPGKLSDVPAPMPPGGMPALQVPQGPGSGQPMPGVRGPGQPMMPQG